MHAMVLNAIGSPLVWTELPDRKPGPGEIRVKVAACGVCRTDLHVVGGELPNPHVPIIPGHEVVGRVDALGMASLDWRLARGWAYRGWAIPAASAPIAAMIGKIFATLRNSRAIRETVVMRPPSLRTPVSHSLLAKWEMTFRWRRCFAQDSSAGVHSS